MALNEHQNMMLWMYLKKMQTLQNIRNFLIDRQLNWKISKNINFKNLNCVRPLEIWWYLKRSIEWSDHEKLTFFTFLVHFLQHINSHEQFLDSVVIIIFPSPFCVSTCFSSSGARICAAFVLALACLFHSTFNRFELKFTHI